jgi:hypothetical protein
MSVSDQIPAAFAGDAKVKAAWSDFSLVVADALASLAAKPSPAPLPILAADGQSIGSVDIADVRFKLSNIAWSLATGGVGNGGVGEMKSTFAKPGQMQTWKAGEAQVQVDGLLGYSLWHAKGFHYLVLHETAHVTRLGLDTWMGGWTEFLKTRQPQTKYNTSPQWHWNEQVANQIAKVVGDWIGFDELPAPTEGFPLSFDRTHH